MSETSTPRAFTLQEPERFLRMLDGSRGRLDLAGVSLTEMWSLTAIAALARRSRASPLQVENWEDNARKFALGVGFEDLIAGTLGDVRGEPGKTVRLTEVWAEDEVKPVASAVAELLSRGAPRRQSSQFAIEYMMTELLRNVLQHSQEPGTAVSTAVSGAQRNDRGLHQTRPMYQVAIADNGRGILSSLQQRHQDLDNDAVALERSLWPHFSRAFAFGRTGGEVNAGLGLFFVSELVKELEGRLLVSSGKSSLLIDTALPRRQQFISVGYPGTLVAFEIPVEATMDFQTLFEAIGRRADERTPRRLVQERLRYDAAPANTKQFLVSLFLENNEEAARLAAAEIVPRLAKKESIVLDFVNVSLCTQSFAHALLFEPIRVSWATRTPIFIVNAAAVVRSALKHVEMYSQSG